MRATRKYRADCYYIAKRAIPKGWESRPVEIAVEYRCPPGSSGYRARDHQNAIAAMKAGIDGLVDAGVMRDDSWKHLRWGAFQINPSTGVKPGITIYVKALSSLR